MSSKKSKKRFKLFKKLRRAPKPDLNAIIDHLPGRVVESTPEENLQNLPRITNETVAEHREEVLSSARKYIYPTAHPRHRVVKISLTLFLFLVVAFFTFCGLELYKFKSTSGFLYEVTRVIPFPVAKAGPSYVAYENYLFEVRRYIHYYETQQKADLSSKNGKAQLVAYRKQALQQVIDDAYVKQLAAKHHVSVSDQDVNDEIALTKAQNRLGSSDQMLSDVLKQFWGWSIDDFKRELKTQLLAQKVAAALDTKTQARAQSVLTQLKGGADFAALAGQNSDDASTRGNGGQYGIAIQKTLTISSV